MPRLPCKRWHFYASNGDDDDLSDKRVSVPFKSASSEIRTELLFIHRNGTNVSRSVFNDKILCTSVDSKGFCFIVRMQDNDLFEEAF